jgi:hypothetical protein
MGHDDADVLLAGLDPAIRAIAERVRAVVRAEISDAVEEVDIPGRMVGYTFQPGTYRGLIVAIMPHTAHVNLMFARGAELVDRDPAGLLTGTGKKARHIAFRDTAAVDRGEVRSLIREAARLTPRPASGE